MNIGAFKKRKITLGLKPKKKKKTLHHHTTGKIRYYGLTEETND